MSTIAVLEALQAFLQDKVTPTIELQKPSNNNVKDYTLVNPSVHIGWLPPNGYLPDGMESAIPCLVVGLDDASEDAQGKDLNIRISAAVYSPGLHAPDASGVIIYTPDFQGYRDLLNLMDRTLAKLTENRVVNGVTIQETIKWGMYLEQPHPYWYGWIAFTVSKPAIPPAEIARDLL